ncbi:MAG: TRZ/ATZ family hydrolase [Rhodanobacteraceae bacterium]
MSDSAQPVDLAIHARWVLPIEPGTTLLEEHAVVVDKGVIKDVLPQKELSARFAPRETVSLDEHVLMPGLVNAHTHNPMSLMRGLADDLPLMDWLENHIWPAEAKLMGPEFIRDGVELAVAEMLRGGTTCANENYFFPDVIGATYRRLGFRACVGLPIIEFPSPWARSRDEYFDRALAVHDELNGQPLLSTSFVPHAPYTVSDESFERIRVLSDQLDIPVHLHCHETAQEIADSKRDFGVRPMQRLQQLGIVNDRLIAVHMTAVTDAEIRQCAEAGVSVVHCPESNLKLASGFCPAEQFREAGVNLAIGTDGCASNNDLDMFGEMRTAAQLAKAVAQKADAFSAGYALQAATLNGARAMGLDDKIGSIVPGKEADLVAVRIGDELECQPLYDVCSQLVYACNRKQVSDVWIHGARKLDSGRLSDMSEPELLARARSWRDRIAAI